MMIIEDRVALLAHLHGHPLKRRESANPTSPSSSTSGRNPAQAENEIFTNSPPAKTAHERGPLQEPFV